MLKEKYDMSKKSSILRTWLPDILIMLLAALILFFWIWEINGRAAGPDEPMRYQVAVWLYKHPGQLPLGDAPELRDPNWGFSYAFYPILSYMVSALFMTITSFFSTTPDAMLQSARVAPALFVLLAAMFTLRTGKKLFGRTLGYLYSCLVIFLPGFLYLGTYVNNDSLALLSAAMIFYSWACAAKDGWRVKTCILLAVSMGICFLSYYNAYAWILWSFFYFCGTILFSGEKPLSVRFRELFAKGLLILAITFIVCGWWFIRNVILYGNDILGMAALNRAGELYAIPELRPSNHMAPIDNGWSLIDLIFYQHPGWLHNWLVTSVYSFIGTFGIFDLYMNETVSKIYVFFFLICLIGTVFTPKLFALCVRRPDGKRAFHEKGFLSVILLLTMITCVLLFVYYAYCSDIQAQGRYFILAVYPLMYFTVHGIETLLSWLKCSPGKAAAVQAAIALIWTLAAVLNFVLLVAPAFSGIVLPFEG